MSESLDRELEAQYKGVPNAELMRRMQAAPDFGYDDYEYELSRRLSLVGLAWKWAGKYGSEHVEVYAPENESEVRGYD